MTIRLTKNEPPPANPSIHREFSPPVATHSVHREFSPPLATHSVHRDFSPPAIAHHSMNWDSSPPAAHHSIHRDFSPPVANHSIPDNDFVNPGRHVDMPGLDNHFGDYSRPGQVGNPGDPWISSPDFFLQHPLARDIKLQSVQYQVQDVNMDHVIICPSLKSTEFWGVFFFLTFVIIRHEELCGRF